MTETPEGFWSFHIHLIELKSFLGAFSLAFRITCWPWL